MKNTFKPHLLFAVLLVISVAPVRAMSSSSSAEYLSSDDGYMSGDSGVSDRNKSGSETSFDEELDWEDIEGLIQHDNAAKVVVKYQDLMRADAGDFDYLAILAVFYVESADVQPLMGLIQNSGSSLLKALIAKNVAEVENLLILGERVLGHHLMCAIFLHDKALFDCLLKYAQVQVNGLKYFENRLLYHILQENDDAFDWIKTLIRYGYKPDYHDMSLVLDANDIELFTYIISTVDDVKTVFYPLKHGTYENLLLEVIHRKMSSEYVKALLDKNIPLDGVENIILTAGMKYVSKDRVVTQDGCAIIQMLRDACQDSVKCIDRQALCQKIEVYNTFLLAIEKGDVERVEELLLRGCDPNVIISSDGKTPLVLAVKAGQPDCVVTLLAHGTRRGDAIKNSHYNDSSQAVQDKLSLEMAMNICNFFEKQSRERIKTLEALEYDFKQGKYKDFSLLLRYPNACKRLVMYAPYFWITKAVPKKILDTKSNIIKTGSDKEWLEQSLSRNAKVMNFEYSEHDPKSDNRPLFLQRMLLWSDYRQGETLKTSLEKKAFSDIVIKTKD